ncbi:hypothetical protein N658DRAFT_325195 [Parathielavia hyrcaniae]|uniref:Uncharacterized protein n=1 Tax=Parathielavia hyrcaniae TaxID=113614 RepID=A0AAN6Q6T1_9PEZI|nr:hypothetical protein N658DRAFT_325195 [Parathielavia hyrcaniae]
MLARLGSPFSRAPWPFRFELTERASLVETMEKADYRLARPTPHTHPIATPGAYKLWLFFQYGQTCQPCPFSELRHTSFRAECDESLFWGRSLARASACPDRYPFCHIAFLLCGESERKSTMGDSSGATFASVGFRGLGSDYGHMSTLPPPVLAKTSQRHGQPPRPFLGIPFLPWRSQVPQWLCEWDGQKHPIHASLPWSKRSSSIHSARPSVSPIWNSHGSRGQQALAPSPVADPHIPLTPSSTKFNPALCNALESLLVEFLPRRTVWRPPRLVDWPCDTVGVFTDLLRSLCLFNCARWGIPHRMESECRPG